MTGAELIACTRSLLSVALNDWVTAQVSLLFYRHYKYTTVVAERVENETPINPAKLYVSEV